MPEVIICRACAQPFLWERRSARRPHYCKDRRCTKDRANLRSRLYMRRKRGDVPELPPGAVRPLPYLTPPQPPEPTSLVERLLAQAKAARLARERATGQRTYTITDGWQQKPGAGHFDAGADTDSAGGWNV